MAVFAADMSFEDLPQDVVESAKRIFVDAAGCALASHREEPRKARIATGIAEEFAATGPSTIIGGGMSHPAFASFANGFMINAADNDDTHKRALIHTGSVVVPAALAVSEAMGGSGRKFIEALTCGYEIAVRVGMAVMPTHYRYWHSTATNGTFGAAVSAAKAYGLDAKGIQAALGFAGTQAAGLNTFFESGDDTKSLHPGKASFNGVLSAMLVARGATSPPDILGHEKGYLSAFSSEPKPDRLVSGLGERWEILENGFKPYPSILASHSPIGATLEIVSANQVQPSEITSIVIRTYGTVKTHFSNKNITTPMSARLSVPYCVAAAIVDGEITQEQFKNERFMDKDIVNVLANTEVVADPELTELYPEKFPAHVSVFLDNGRKLEATFMYPKGDPKNPLSRDELEEKFRKNAAGLLSEGRINEFFARVRDIGAIKISTVTDLLGKSRSKL